MRAACLPATLLVAACSFSSPGAGGGDDGGGGGIDAPPPCADGDDDADTVCNAVDKCAGQDDRLDVDGDGAPDGCDDWPCGMKPDDPGGTMSDSAGTRSWGAALIDIGDSRRVVASAGEQFRARFGWSLEVDCGDLGSCRAQLEIGYDATRLRCLFDGTVNDESLMIRGADVQLTAPPTPGEVHEIRLNVGLLPMCGMTPTFYDGDPGPESTIAILCVRP